MRDVVTDCAEIVNSSSKSDITYLTVSDIIYRVKSSERSADK